jgi:hypothetical protein
MNVTLLLSGNEQRAAGKQARSKLDIWVQYKVQSGQNGNATTVVLALSS